MAKERRTILVALGMGLLAGMLAALGIVVLSSTTAVAADEGAPDLLPGVDLVTVEVEPGVYRVLSDGVRELSNVPAGAAADDEPAFWDFLMSPNIAAGRTAVWWFGPDGFFRLGDDQTHEWDLDGLRPHSDSNRDIEIAPDGAPWVADDGLHTFDGASWSVVQPSSVSIEIEEDGTVWSAWKTGKRHVISRLVDGAWERFGGQLPEHQRSGLGGLSLSDDGSPWVVKTGALFRHAGEGWRRVDTPRGRPVWGAVAADGTGWVQLQRKNKFVLARQDGDGWTVDHTLFTFDGAMGASEPKVAQVLADLGVAPDGGLWANHVEGPSGRNECRGVTRFGESEPRHFLGDLCVLAMDVAPDGKVWLQAGEVRDMASRDRIYESLGPVHTYVITPEAVAGTE